LLLFSFWTFERNKVWSDKITLWGDCVAKSPGKARPHNNLGVALDDRNRTDEAVDHFRQTIAIDPQFAEAYNNPGTEKAKLSFLSTQRMLNTRKSRSKQ